MTVYSQPVNAPRIRVLVVDDSALQRGLLVAFLELDAELEIVGTADSGMQAIEKARQLLPDVITMDLRMPGMDGLKAAQEIMAQQPIPILLVTASISRDDQRLVASAFSAGILAIVAKPSVHALELHDEFRRMVKGVSRIKLVRRHSSATRSAPSLSAPPEQRSKMRSSLAAMPAHIKRLEVIGMASSTGGPQVLEQILSTLPVNFPVPVLVVQHIAHGFAPSLVEWLDSRCHLPVRIAEAGLALQPGVWIADGKHLIVQAGKFGVSTEANVSGHCPSGTVLFKSLAAEFGAAALGVILTGMGEDGAIGLQTLHDSGGVTIAQNFSSSVVHGMPGAAIALGAADFALPPDDIARAMLDFVRRGRQPLEW